jgi:hypothetical protein
MQYIDLPGAIAVMGIVFWLAGGSDWLAQKTRKMKLDNDEREARLNKVSDDV